MTLKLAKPTGASLKLAKPTGAKLLMRPAWQPMDADAAAYITAVETADGQALEEKTKIAIDNFVLGCKADGIWSAIKASCILAGARTLSGALVPLVGTAPTNFNFVSGDYNRKTGLVGNATTKYLDSNRNNNADPQNNKHISTYATSFGAAAGGHIGNPSANTGDSQIFVGGSGGTKFIRLNTGSSVAFNATSVAPFTGVSRARSSDYVVRINQGSTVVNASSQSPANANIHIFKVNAYINGRLAFYSIGESLDLVLLDARVTDLINAFAAAIP